ncbi:hypothetical protein MWU78_16635 [Arenibacter sp. F26102]|uniref:hypothetical protein n=1 Tax=Arenibacter sp. F26102 TaxID=2926416 RepID=UPI001FF29643|nr:hypothetical protein [Arenibacter sp. F26102]MCK0147288.1 hypothetical protein [Arenibacter sp. F26102]
MTLISLSTFLLQVQMDATKELIIDIAVELLYQTFVRADSIMFMEHQCQFALRAENRNGPFFMIDHTKGVHQAIPWYGRIYLT